jgi:hypothetical protein
MAYEVINSSLEDWSKGYTGPKYHAVLCDPPYGLKFMGKDWDVVSAREWGEALLPHLYPGALVFMFGGTRTWHKLATGMEEAGFQIWDTLMWLYGQGFPKAQDISKLIDKKLGNEREVIGKEENWGKSTAEEGKVGYGDYAGAWDITAPGSNLSAPWAGHKTPALKPAWEPILAFRKPAKQTYADLALEYGSGSLNIDSTRIEHVTVDGGSLDKNPHLRGTINGGNGGNIIAHETERRVVEVNQLGRYPANLILDEKAGALLDEQFGFSVTHRNHKPSDCSTEGEVFSGQTFQGNRGPRGYSDSGGASRFFYCAKATTKERNAGLDELPDKPFGMSNQAKAEIKRGTESFENSNMGVNSVKLVKNNHPTVKPLALTEYLAKLLLPPDSVSPRRLLVPFAGSGSEMIGALRAGWEEITGVEREAEYCTITTYRLAGQLHANDN